MKKFTLKKLCAFFAAAAVAASLAACGSPAQGGGGPAPEEAPADAPAADPAGGGASDGSYADGTYTSEMFYEGEDGYQDTLELTVEGGKITSVVWDGVAADGGKRSEASESGEYAVADWHVQAKDMADKVIETQDPYAIALNDDGTPADVPGVTIYVSDFIEMAASALYDAQSQQQ